VADQKPLACSNFASCHGGGVGALWTTFVDHSSIQAAAFEPPLDSGHTNAALGG
jgi:hypothetical protein